MQLRRTTLAALSAMLAATALVGVLLAAPASAKVKHVTGEWQNPDPVGLKGLNPLSGDFYGTGQSIWTGDLRGTTTFSVKGRTNLLTGATEGTVDEYFPGKAGRHLKGGMRLLEEFTVAAGTGAFHLIATVDRGTGDFKRASGTITFVGTTATDGVGGGTYDGTLRLPSR
jgi:hypothetical protein